MGPSMWKLQLIGVLVTLTPMHTGPKPSSPSLQHTPSLPAHSPQRSYPQPQTFRLTSLLLLLVGPTEATFPASGQPQNPRPFASPPCWSC